mmetsp:Transcript_10814/g.18428  ORF Transcript_10814/g.18428 Transcript_10814/m.18428 type:complete len:335 (-) Transcript_10814:131-1135(-)
MIDHLTDDPLAVEVQASSSFNNCFISVTNLTKLISPRIASPRVVKRTDSFIRAHDLNLSEEDIQRVIDDERTDRETSERDGSRLVPIDGNGDIVINALVEVGLAEAGDESSRWIATSGTAYVLKKRPKQQRMGPWKNAASGKDVLVWSTKCIRNLGAEYPVVKARGLINASARDVVDLLRDSSKVTIYNKSSLGRKDKVVLTSSVDSEAKIMSSLTKPPIVRKPLECVTLFYARQLTVQDNIELDGVGYITVGRSVWENEDGRTGANSSTARCEILLSVNLVREITTTSGQKVCELTIVTHAVSPACIPLFIGKKAALTAADGYIKDIRAVFEK